MGPDLKSVMEKQITVPMMVPCNLEAFLLNVLPNICTDFPVPKPFLIPVHDPTASLSWTTAHAGLLHLYDTTSEDGNLRYWVITKRSMWAGQNHVTDDVFGILWALSEIFRINARHGTIRGCTSTEAVWHMAAYVRRRAVQPRFGQSNEADSTRIARTTAHSRRGPSAAEARLFRAWVLAEPIRRDRRAHFEKSPPFEEDAFMYPVPDELFWKDRDAGEWNGEDVPPWRCVPVDAKAERGCGRRKRTSADASVGDGYSA